MISMDIKPTHLSCKDFFFVFKFPAHDTVQVQQFALILVNC